jgi:hypothetical protein
MCGRSYLHAFVSKTVEDSRWRDSGPGDALGEKSVGAFADVFVYHFYRVMDSFFSLCGLLVKDDPIR